MLPPGFFCIACNQELSQKRIWLTISPSNGNTIRIIVSGKNDSKRIYRKFHLTASKIVPVTYCGQLKTSETEFKSKTSYLESGEPRPS